MTTKRLIPANGIELCAQTFGEPEHPAVLLIGGMSSPMDWWEDELCERIAAGPRYVVRYDHRDTGGSTTYPPGRPGYTGADLRDDAIALLDALGIRTAHLVGVSMGGAIAQCLAVEAPDRVSSLTLVDTTAALSDAPAGLPGIEPELLAHLAAAREQPDPDWADCATVVERLVEDQRAFMRGGFEETRVRAIVEQIVERSVDVAAMVNHAQVAPGREAQGSLADIAAPTLVVHGTADPLFPFAHGEALAAAIPSARLLPLPGVGHELPPPAEWDRFVAALLQHTASS